MVHSSVLEADSEQGAKPFCDNIITSDHDSCLQSCIRTAMLLEHAGYDLRIDRQILMCRTMLHAHKLQSAKV